MDEKITAVLDAYHERIRQEEEGYGVTPGGNAHERRDQVLLPVGPDTGRLINIIVKSLDAPNILELGTSYGYSGIWLAEAARATRGRVTTVELADYKAEYARDMAAKAGLSDYIDFKVGDALGIIDALPPRSKSGIDFVLLDLWKDMYVPCLEAFLPKLIPGAIIVADNMITPGGDNVKAYGRAVRATLGMTSILLPVGAGLEVSVYEPG
jgi:predicted O-methyltransferase YrrM